MHEHAHPAIIDEETFEKVRQEFTRRSMEAEQKKEAVDRRKAHARYALNGLLVYPWCGENYRRTIWKTGGVRYGVWRCGNRLEGGKLRCGKSVLLKETELQKMLYKVFTWKLKENAESSELTAEQLAVDIVEFESFLDAGMIEKIEVFAKNEVHLWFRDGKMKMMDCSEKRREEIIANN